VPTQAVSPRTPGLTGPTVQVADEHAPVDRVLGGVSVAPRGFDGFGLLAPGAPPFGQVVAVARTQHYRVDTLDAVCGPGRRRRVATPVVHALPELEVDAVGEIAGRADLVGEGGLAHLAGAEQCHHGKVVEAGRDVCLLDVLEH
jgi:hypothetical protein